MKTEIFEFNGYTATIIVPDNPNGKWIWKTEFLYAFDQAERELSEQGYTRVYYKISDMFGSPRAVNLMKGFHEELLKKYFWLKDKAILFGFSRGGLYAFNYAFKCPRNVDKVYFDAPVLNLKSWPTEDSVDQKMFFEEYGLDKQSFKIFHDSPIDNLDAFCKNGIPILMVAGDSDEVVPYSVNGKIMVDFYRRNNIEIIEYLKKGCGHHPHSLENIKPILEFVNK